MSDQSISERLGTSSQNKVTDTPLTIREHLDPDKHWIGETLPAASSSESRPSGSSSSAGYSPYPARADHTHDSQIVYGHYYHSGLFIASTGAAYFPSWVYYSGRNLLAPASTQLFLFPTEGMYIIAGTGQIVGGAAFGSSWCRLRLSMHNVTYILYVLEEGVASPFSTQTFSFSAVAMIYPPVTSSLNVQLMFENYTGQDVTLYFSYLTIYRVASTTSA